MNRNIIKSDSRGAADFGWLKTRYSFSFADYYNPERINFGVLRVLNDDIVSPGKGFDTHPHSNMEIITIPLEGDLSHRDSMGNERIIKQGEIQVMSAGTGIRHSEYNARNDIEVKFLQIWLFPREKELKPRYDQKMIRELGIENELINILSPEKNDKGVWVNQDAWFYMGFYSVDTTESYNVTKKGNGIYLFVLKGSVTLDGEQLDERDAMTVEGEDKLDFNIKAGSEILIMDISMTSQ